MRHHSNVPLDGGIARSSGATSVRRSAIALLLAGIALSIGVSPVTADAASADGASTQAVVCKQLRPKDDTYFQAACRNAPAGTVRYFTRIVCTDKRTYQGPAEIGILGQYGRWSRASCPSGHKSVSRMLITVP
jgi:hypothetical protein